MKMRPDQHKKRKNADYKKKHGLSNKSEGQDTDSKKAGKDKKVKDKSNDKNEGPVTDKNAPIGKVKEEKTESREPEYDDFRRRQLVSNWSRYDDSDDNDDDDDIPEQRGEDFNKLMMEAGGSAAQFRFKDEEDWSETDEDNVTSSLCLDLDNLAESISCIQLHQRLGVDEALLSEEQIMEIKATAANNEQIYYLKYPKDSNETKNIVKPSTKSGITTACSNVDSANTDKRVKKEQNNTNTNVKKSINKSANISDKVSKSAKESVPESKIEDTVKSKDKETLSLEDDLDMLLSLDEPVNIQKVNSKETVKFNKAVNGESKVKTTETAKKVSDKPTDTAALEDWLDSVLDG
ncbi:hypothetical protein ACF0H5_002634 [Mactra antiquata]